MVQAISSSPLIIGADLSDDSFVESIIDVIGNTEAIAVSAPSLYPVTHPPSAAPAVRAQPPDPTDGVGRRGDRWHRDIYHRDVPLAVHPAGKRLQVVHGCVHGCDGGEGCGYARVCAGVMGGKGVRVRACVRVWGPPNPNP